MIIDFEDIYMGITYLKIIVTNIITTTIYILWKFLESEVELIFQEKIVLGRLNASHYIEKLSTNQIYLNIYTHALTLNIDYFNW